MSTHMVKSGVIDGCRAPICDAADNPGGLSGWGSHYALTDQESNVDCPSCLGILAAQWSFESLCAEKEGAKDLSGEICAALHERAARASELAVDTAVVIDDMKHHLEEMKMQMNQKLRVWWKPQIQCESFLVPVDTVAEGVKLLDVLADYDQFQLDQSVKPDYCNTGGLMMFDPSDDEDGPEGSWVQWCDEFTGEDDPRRMRLYDYKVLGVSFRYAGEIREVAYTYKYQDLDLAQKKAKALEELGFKDVSITPVFDEVGEEK